MRSVQTVCLSAFSRARGETVGRDSEDEDLGVKLLSGIKRVFDEQQTDRLGTIDLIKGLVASADGPWPAMFEDLLRHEKHQTAASRLTKLLRDYRRSDGERLRPRKIRVDDETVQDRDLRC